MTRPTETGGALGILATILLPAALAAHQGHAPDASLTGVAHWLSSPGHLTTIVVAAALLVGAWGVRVLVRRVPRGEGAVREA